MTKNSEELQEMFAGLNPDGSGIEDFFGVEDKWSKQFIWIMMETTAGGGDLKDGVNHVLAELKRFLILHGAEMSELERMHLACQAHYALGAMAADKRR